jgi:hypothetical protein
MAQVHSKAPGAPTLTTKQRRFAEEVKSLLDSGRGTESINLFCRGASLEIYPEHAALRPWLVTTIGEDATRQLITLFAVSSCAFCRRGLEACSECDRHGHFDYSEICEACLGLGACRCGFCNGSGFSGIEEVPRGIRIPVSLERAAVALQQIDVLSQQLTSEPAIINPRDSLKEQAALILHLNGFLGTLENELGDDRQAPWWTPQSTTAVSHLVKDWPQVCKRTQERICGAFQSMSKTSRRMAEDAVEGSDAKSLALARGVFFERFTTPDTLDRTDVDHPILDRIRSELGSDT